MKDFDKDLCENSHISWEKIWKNRPKIVLLKKTPQFLATSFSQTLNGI